MSLKCCVEGCKMKIGQKKVSFHRFPIIQTARDSIRRELWIEAVGMKGRKISNHVICGQHFETGKPAPSSDTGAENWIPTLRLSNRKGFQTDWFSAETGSSSVVEHINDYESVILLEDDIDQDDLPAESEDLLKNSNVYSDYEFEMVAKSNYSFQDSEIIDMEEEWLEDEGTKSQEEILIRKYEDALNEKDCEIRRLERIIDEQCMILKQLKFDLDSFKDNDTKVKHFTGLPSYTTLVLVFNFVERGLLTFSNVLSKEQTFILVLMYLRLGLSFNTLGYMFGVSHTTITKYFYSALYSMYNQLKGLIKWPAPDILKMNCPPKYKNIFSDHITVIVDCFEIFTEKPGMRHAIIKMYSNYKHHKHHYTVKEMIGITPFGSISFISKPYTGRTSDKYIIEKSGFLDNLGQGDLVLADRGFTVKKAIADKGATLKVPESSTKRNQMSSAAVERTRALASVRNEVERTIGGLRQKYEILSNRLPITLLNHEHNGEAVLNMIVVVCSALFNLCPSIIV